MPGFLDSERLFFADFELDTVRRALCRSGEDLRLPPKEYQVLECLARRAGSAVSREELMAAVWPGVVVGDASLARCVSALRRHLGAGSIQAVPKFGYRFALPVSVAETVTTVPAPQIKADEPKGDRRSRRLPAWGWASVGAAVLLLAWMAHRQLQAVTAQADDRLTWFDPQTGLTWQRQDNGVGRARGEADVDRAEAMQYCEALRLGGRNDWRLPTMEELQTLYNTAKSEEGMWGGYRSVYWHINGGIAVSGGETANDLTWLTDQTPVGEEQSFDFSYGRRNYDPAGFRADHRALCVRNDGRSHAR